jgi:hypothetical protein
MTFKVMFSNVLIATYALAEPCEVKKTFAEIAQLSSTLDPIISVTEMTNVPQFCQVNGYRDRDAENIRSFWTTSFVASKDFREQNFLSVFASPKPDFNVYPSEKLTDMSDSQRTEFYTRAEKAIENTPDVLSNSYKQKFLKGVANFSARTEQQSKTIEVSTLQSGYLCTDITILKALSCAEGVKDAIAIARPVDNVTVLPLWKELVTDSAYLKVFKKVSLGIIANLRKGTPPQKTLIEDLKAEFLALTKDKKKADDYAWKTMALLASGGGNALKRPAVITGANDGGNDDLEAVLHVLSNGSMALDRLSAEKGFLYTFPPGIKNLCDYGKNYHFWMTAYLARELKKKNYSETAAAAAAFSVEKGYQFSKVEHGRDPTKPFTESPYSNYNNNIRLDLSLAAAGAWYGAQNEKGEKTISRSQFDGAIRSSFQGAVKLDAPIAVAERDFSDPSPIKTMGLYKNWKKVINPDAAFKLFEITENKK